jgi:selenoprotein W-related protein
MSMTLKPRISIEYCPRCGWLLRSAWLAQELLTTFEKDVLALELVPSEVSGTFQIKVGDALVWCRRRDAGFPQAAEIKRRVRDVVAPGRPLGHSEAKDAAGNPTET